MANIRFRHTIMGGSRTEGSLFRQLRNQPTPRARLQRLAWLQWPLGAALMIALVIWVYWGNPPWLR